MAEGTMAVSSTGKHSQLSQLSEQLCCACALCVAPANARSTQCQQTQEAESATAALLSLSALLLQMHAVRCQQIQAAESVAVQSSCAHNGTEQLHTRLTKCLLARTAFLFSCWTCSSMGYHRTAGHWLPFCCCGVQISNLVCGGDI